MMYLLLLLGAALVRADDFTQIHTALAGTDGSGNSNAMSISFQTESDLPAAVRFGKAADDLSMQVPSTSSSYYATYDHHAVLPDLDPGTQYFYQIVSDGSASSSVNSFSSAPLSD